MVPHSQNVPNEIRQLTLAPLHQMIMVDAEEESMNNEETYQKHLRYGRMIYRTERAARDYAIAMTMPKE